MMVHFGYNERNTFFKDCVETGFVQFAHRNNAVQDQIEENVIRLFEWYFGLYSPEVVFGVVRV